MKPTINAANFQSKWTIIRFKYKRCKFEFIEIHNNNKLTTHSIRLTDEAIIKRELHLHAMCLWEIEIHVTRYMF
jgi:hypothetical protein